MPPTPPPHTEPQPPPDEGEASVEEESSKDFQAIDKDKWEEILQQLDPDDFKYKM
jgi:hypothetical protein